MPKVQPELTLLRIRDRRKKRRWFAFVQFGQGIRLTDLARFVKKQIYRYSLARAQLYDSLNEDDVAYDTHFRF